MHITRKYNDRFSLLFSQVKNTYNVVDATGAGVFVIHNDKVVLETYWGKHSNASDARPIQADSQFHVASVRKSYIGFAVAYAVYKGYIESIDDEVTKYLPATDSELLNKTTIRHLLTHTHGLNKTEGNSYREFAPGQSWAYRAVGIDMLTQIIKITTGKTISKIINEQVLNPLMFKETGWYGVGNEKLVEVIRTPNDPNWYTSKSTDGDKMNMYVSARELAYWGYVHLKKGFINGEQVVSKRMIELATTLQSPNLLNKDLPQNGYLWFLKDLPAKKTEIGESVPQGSYQILGYTNVAILVIPKHDVVAVRMFNSFGSPDGYDYLADIRNFGDTVMECL